MSNLEDFPELSKWLDDNMEQTDDNYGLSWGIVGAKEVEAKLIELGTRVEELEFELKEHLSMINWQSKMLTALTKNKE